MPQPRRPQQHKVPEAARGARSVSRGGRGDAIGERAITAVVLETEGETGKGEGKGRAHGQVSARGEEMRGVVVEGPSRDGIEYEACNRERDRE